MYVYCWKTGNNSNISNLKCPSFQMFICIYKMRNYSSINWKVVLYFCFKRWEPCFLTCRFCKTGCQKRGFRCYCIEFILTEQIMIWDASSTVDVTMNAPGCTSIDQPGTIFWDKTKIQRPKRELWCHWHVSAVSHSCVCHLALMVVAHPVENLVNGSGINNPARYFRTLLIGSKLQKMRMIV